MRRLLKRHGKLLLRACGAAGLGVAVYFLVSGIYFLSQDSTQMDSEGFFSTWKIHVKKTASAIVMEPLGMKFAGGWNTGASGILKVKVSDNNPADQIFIGTGAETTVRQYLNGIAYDKITGLYILPMHAAYETVTGDVLPVNPVSETFWTNTGYGKGTQELFWNPGKDNTSLVLMNLDGSAGVDMKVTVLTKVAALFIAGAGGIMIGVFTLILSLLLVLGTRKARNSVYPEPLGMLPEK